MRMQVITRLLLPFRIACTKWNITETIINYYTCILKELFRWNPVTKNAVESNIIIHEWYTYKTVTDGRCL